MGEGLYDEDGDISSTAYYFRGISHIAVAERFAVVHNKFHKEWSQDPKNFFTASELKFIFDWIAKQHPDLTILYICHKDRDLGDDRYDTLPMPQYDQLLNEYRGRVALYDDLVNPMLKNSYLGDLPRVTLKNTLQIALLARADIAFSV